MTLQEYRWICPREGEYFTVEMNPGKHIGFMFTMENAKFCYGYCDKDNVPYLKFVNQSPVYSNLSFEYHVKVEDIKSLTRERISLGNV